MGRRRTIDRDQLLDAAEAVIAMYEHKVYVQSILWGINAFDQWGVELGKELGKGVYSRLVGSEETPAEDASTQGLIDFFRGRHRG